MISEQASVPYNFLTGSRGMHDDSQQFQAVQVIESNKKRFPAEVEGSYRDCRDSHAAAEY